MLKVVGAALALAILSGAAFAQPATLQTTLPANSVTITKWYKQNVYDRSDAKIGEIMDVLATDAGQITSFIVGVGGFLGMGEKDVAVAPTAIKTTMKDGKPYLVMDTTKDALKGAPGYTIMTVTRGRGCLTRSDQWRKRCAVWRPNTHSYPTRLCGVGDERDGVSMGYADSPSLQ